jgi:hypothetical protein
MSWPTRAEVGPIPLQWHSETAVDTDHTIMILDCAYVTPEHLLHQITKSITAQLLLFLVRSFAVVYRVDDNQVAQLSPCNIS